MAEVEGRSDIRLRPATPEDRFLIRRWLADPEVQSWWGTAASAEAEITLAMASAARSAAHHRARRHSHRLRPCGRDRAVGRREPPEGVPAGTWDVD